MFNLLRNDLGLFLLMVPAVLIALVVHEVSHGYVAYLCGDNTAKAYGRLTLNPLKHLDPFGAIMMLLIGFGYARPVPVNYRNLRKPRRDIALVALAGPLSNLLLALVACVLYFVILLIYAASADVRLETVAAGIRWLPSPAAYYDQNWLMNALFMGEVPRLLTTFMQFLTLFATVNIGLALFNLVPLPPLDGSKILGSLLPPVLSPPVEPSPVVPEVVPSPPGCSGSCTGAAPALTTTFTRLFSFAVVPAAGFWLSTVPAGWSLYSSLWLPSPRWFCTSRVRASSTLMPVSEGTLVVVDTCGRLI